MTDFPGVFKNGVATSQQKREPTKLECGLLGALIATVALTSFFWLSIQLSLLTIIIR